MRELVVKQGSKNWLKEKMSMIGSSEIFGLISYYITERELQNMGINTDDFTDKPYVSAFELYHKIKNPHLYIGNRLSKSRSMFGKRGEQIIFEILSKNPEYNSTYKRGGVYASDNGISIASLDIEACAHSNDIIFDCNRLPISLLDEPNYFIEVKFESPFNNSSDHIDWKFIFQIQYQMFVNPSFSWGQIISVELNEDNEFTRGYMVGLSMKQAVKFVKENAKIKKTVFKRREDYQILIELALDRFMSDIRSSKEPEVDMGANNEMIFNISEQRGVLLGLESRVFDVDNSIVDKYVSLKAAADEIEAKTKELRKDLVSSMVLRGKQRAVCESGTVLLNKRGLTIRKGKK